MIENSRTAYNALLQNQIMLKAENCQILQQDALLFLAQNKQMPTQKYDIIFCDPPYNKNWLDKLLPVLNQQLSKDGMLYVEAEFKIQSSDNWQVSKQDKAGNVYYHLLKLD